MEEEIAYARHYQDFLRGVWLKCKNKKYSTSWIDYSLKID